ncbi:uncharacterized protein MYCFIDRAFT_177563 [Pseudocercospora fijiensis CIRAD86]|uniref:Uncharacterized protein n=1 Tax=Pseudocercospora fijiensis (strain CIRAD86) TaxID=383855 RepID=M3A7P4_PSEFD|nr:uncharacterized protein MYCFIDRAFT_177563 [Pseudocercospora fijiensis CIRAD86]EME80631.1 hypothetical protein MYCFIDRAFT_177563 [Pseudocercospora fijiensis CIRAD86]
MLVLSKFSAWTRPFRADDPNVFGFFDVFPKILYTMRIVMDHCFSLTSVQNAESPSSSSCVFHRLTGLRIHIRRLIMFPEDVSSYTTHTLDSSIPILPIFSESCFDTSIDYPSLLLSLRLCSLALQTKETLRFLYVLFLSKRKSTTTTTGNLHLETSESPFDNTSLTPFQTQLLLQKLSQLSHLTNFHIDSDPTTSGSAETHINTSLTHPSFPNGYGSEIFLPPLPLQTLADPTLDPPAHLALSYQISHILLHELAHVISNAVDGNIDPEVFFPGMENFASEWGFAMEGVALGGVLERVKFGEGGGAPYRWRDGERGGCWKECRIEKALGWTLWPCKRLVARYLRHGDKIGVRENWENFCKSSEEEGVGEGEIEEMVVLPFECVWKVFQRPFWEETVVEEGKEAFRVEGRERFKKVETKRKREVVLEYGDEDAPGETDDEYVDEQRRRAKRRMFQKIFGMISYIDAANSKFLKIFWYYENGKLQVLTTITTREESNMAREIENGESVSPKREETLIMECVRETFHLRRYFMSLQWVIPS